MSNKKLIFVTNQFRTGGVESVFYQIAYTVRQEEDSAASRTICLLPVHESMDDYLVRRLPDNVILLSSGIDPERTLSGLFATIRRAAELKKTYGGEDYIAVNFSDTLSSLLTAYIISGRRTVSWVHTCPRFFLKKKRVPTWPVYFWLMRRCREVVFLCEDQRKLFLELKETGNTSRLKTRICTDFVDVDEIRAKAAEPIDGKAGAFFPDGPYFLMVSRFEESQKDFRSLILAYSHLPRAVREKYRLVLAGDGTDREKMMSLTEELGIRDRVVFPGNVENPYPWMMNCSLYIHSSRVEGFSMVLVEALACGCRIVASDCETGPSEILGRGKYGRLFTPGNARELRDSILQSLKETNDCSAKSVERARELARIGKKQIKNFMEEYFTENRGRDRNVITDR